MLDEHTHPGKMDAESFLNRAALFATCTRRARELDAINLSQGLPEPLFDEAINAALAVAVDVGWQYADPRGLPELRARIGEQLYAGRVDDVLITSGCTESLYLALHQLGGRFGSTVAFFEPFYPYYVGLAGMVGLGATPVAMRRDGPSLVPDWDALDRCFAAGVRILLLNTPHNPTGWVLSSTDAQQLRLLAERHGVFIIIDEAYRSFVYGPDSAPALPDRADTLALPAAVEALCTQNENCLMAGSFSKLLSATGLRIGWLAGASAGIARAYPVHMHITYCQPAPLQRAVATLLGSAPSATRLSVAARYRAKRDALVAAVEATGMACSAPPGGHFLVADYAGLAAATPPDVFAERFARHYRVMPLPLTPFYLDAGDVTQVRFSFAPAPSVIDEATALLTKTPRERFYD